MALSRSAIHARTATAPAKSGLFRSDNALSEIEIAPDGTRKKVLNHEALGEVTRNVYTQVLDGSLREVVETVGGESFTIVHKAEREDAATAA
jgi:hypothetical protein